VPGAVARAALDHAGFARSGDPVRGRTRLLLDRADGSTLVLASDDVGLDGLVALATALDPERLAPG